MSLAGKVALVTGAQQGIGRATALALARAGADVGVNYLDDPDGASAVARELGGVDVLVNNAGVFPRVPFLEMKEGDWDYVLDVNLKGSFLCAQAAARLMVSQRHAGAIVNLASTAVRGAVLGVHYSASKSGVVGMTRAMALELAPHGIRVNAVAPGLTDTAQPRYGHSEEALAAMGRAVPLGRMAQPDEIADVIVFLASDEARYVTGQTIFANGGVYMP